MPEYCDGFGLDFIGPEDVLASLERLHSDYSELVEKMPDYPFTAERMVADWMEILTYLHQRRDDLVGQRNLMRDWQKYISARFLA